MSIYIQTILQKMIMGGFTLILAGYATAYNKQAIEPTKASNLNQHLQQIVSTTQYRNHKNINELNRVAAYIKQQVELSGIPCEYQNYQVEEHSYRNVVCKLNADKAKTIIVGAHYDTYGEQQGADDNASGIAGLIELARVMSKQKDRLRHNIDFVAYTLEEPPYFRTEYMGSYIHAQSLQARKDKIEGVIVLEMIGYFSEKNEQNYPIKAMKWIYPKHGNFIAAVSNFSSRNLGKDYCAAMNKYNRLQCSRLVAPASVQGVDFSDHLNYWNLGYKALMITDTSFYRNDAYHTKQDTLDRLNTNKMAHVLDGISRMLLK